MMPEMQSAGSQRADFDELDVATPDPDQPLVYIWLGLTEDELEQSVILSSEYIDSLGDGADPVERDRASRNLAIQRKALNLLDRLQVLGKYEEFIAHLANKFAEHSNTQSRADLIEKNDRFWRVENAFQNFRAGMESSEPDQRARFHSFWEGIVTKVYAGSAPLNGYYRAVHEHLELFEALERAAAPQRPVERRGPVDDSLALREMKCLVLLKNQTVRSAALAAVDLAAKTGGTRESVAKRLERAYNAKRKLREN